ncbi:hypothetical protein MMU07_08010 [Aquiflexum sp. LQ15W]|uniref:hypothetical protein n=1 Tax=Cognataquiflexum nitidum TaxID=2922272 RepID=UPI001F140F41|nr:hypothetical protein [Cognataquiflexum nitidum]MCH6199518.1 hypothetical protein [Cognataquiflexum nitidum]
MKKMKSFLALKVLPTFCLLSFFYQLPTFAQTNEKEKKMDFLVEPYIMFPNMNGQTGIGDLLNIPVDANPGDIFSRLQMAFMLNTELRTDKWAVTSDFVYMRLNQDIRSGLVINSGDVTAKQFIWEAVGLYRVKPFLEIGIGGRLNSLDIEVDALINQPSIGEPVIRTFSTSQTETWYDPIIVTRLTTEFKEKWELQFRGDIGGFGIGSDLTWQLQGYVGYRFSDLFLLTAGYRVIYMDFESGQAPRAFVFDMHQFGPVIKFGFNF